MSTFQRTGPVFYVSTLSILSNCMIVDSRALTEETRIRWIQTQNKAEAAYNKIKEIMNEGVYKAEERLSRVWSVFTGSWDEAKDHTSRIYEKAAEAGQEQYEKLSRAGQGGYEKAARAGEETYEGATQAGREGYEKATEAAKEGADEGYEKAARRAEQVVSEAKETAGQTLKQARQKVEGEL